MQRQAVDGHMGREIEIDLCVPCQSIWFDARENLQLTPGATLGIFRVIGERVSKPAPQERDIAKCPRCNAQLRRTKDMQRSTRFEYFRCPNEHGRLTTFFDFLKEKDFVKPLTPLQIAELRQERPEHQLLELRRPDRSCEGLGLRALRIAALDARHAPGRAVDRPAA